MSYLKALSIDHINMNVTDLEESAAFYAALFGFRLRKDQPEQHSQIIGNDAIKLCLYENPAKVRDGGVNHFGFHIENFDEIIEKCEALDVPHYVVNWPGSRSVYIEDPNGYDIELSELAGGGL